MTLQQQLLDEEARAGAAGISGGEACQDSSGEQLCDLTMLPGSSVQWLAKSQGQVQVRAAGPARCQPGHWARDQAPAELRRCAAVLAGSASSRKHSMCIMFFFGAGTCSMACAL
jgi:hypothetical protein